jgi:acetyl esterase
MKIITSSLKGSFLLLLSLFAQSVYAEHEISAFKDIEWAKPQGFALTSDIYVPDNSAHKMPVLIIYHGGGWLLNSKSIMDDLAQYIAKHAQIVVVNVNYRVLADVDNTTTANQIIEDAMGAVLWVKDNIAQYQGDPQKIAVTGDSAGGHLAAMVTLAGQQLDSDGFAGSSLGFTPSYLPKGKNAEQVAAQNGLAVQATILSYAGFDLYAAAKNGFETANNPFWKWANATPRGMFGPNINLAKNADFYHAVSPQHYIVNQDVRALGPQFVLVGSDDPMTPPASSANYVKQLKDAGQPATLKIYPNRTHGFLDSGCPPYSSGCFSELAIPTVKDMIDFLNEVFAIH